MTTPKKTTVAELKTFIDAVEFASDKDNWVPSERQWNRIRDMINNLDDAPPAPPQVSHPPHHVMQLPQAPHPMAHIPMGMDTPGVPAGPSSLGGGMPAQLPPQQMMNPRAPLATGMNGTAAMPVRTPDIDTSNGQGYTSSFA